MDLIDGNGRLEPVFSGTPREPVRVVPAIVFQIGDDGAGVGAKLGTEGVGVGLERKNVSIRTNDFEFVNGAFGQFGKENFPDAGGAARAHGMDAAVPTIEVADDADAARAGRPDGKVDAANAFEGDEMRAEFLVGVVVATFAHEIQVELGEDARKSVGVVEFKRLAVVRAAL